MGKVIAWYSKYIIPVRKEQATSGTVLILHFEEDRGVSNVRL